MNLFGCASVLFFFLFCVLRFRISVTREDEDEVGVKDLLAKVGCALY